MKKLPIYTPSVSPLELQRPMLPLDLDAMHALSERISRDPHERHAIVHDRGSLLAMLDLGEAGLENTSWFERIGGPPARYDAVEGGDSHAPAVNTIASVNAAVSVNASVNVNVATNASVVTSTSTIISSTVILTNLTFLWGRETSAPPEVATDSPVFACL